MKNYYTTPASELGRTARELVLKRLAKLDELRERGKSIKDTTMLRAFQAAA